MEDEEITRLVDLRADGSVRLAKPEGGWVRLRVPEMKVLRELRSAWYELNEDIAEAALAAIDAHDALETAEADAKTALAATEEGTDKTRAMAAHRAAGVAVRDARDALTDAQQDRRAQWITLACERVGDGPAPDAAWIADETVIVLILGHWMNAPLVPGAQRGA